jgi:cob(I)alamin adenosyltransferase
MKIYTRKGDDGTTGLYYGGRVRKDDAAPAAYGDVDEAQSAIGLARAEARTYPGGIGGELDSLLIDLERDLWVLMADLATEESNRDKLVPGSSRVNNAMVDKLEAHIDDLTSRFEMPKEFVVPGQNKISAYLDVARTVVRRAERTSLAAVAEDSLVLTYLNRLSDLLWTIARWQEHGASLTSRIDVSA